MTKHHLKNKLIKKTIYQPLTVPCGKNETLTTHSLMQVKVNLICCCPSYAGKVSSKYQ